MKKGPDRQTGRQADGKDGGYVFLWMGGDLRGDRPGLEAGKEDIFLCGVVCLSNDRSIYLSICPI
jgi:hypothetical protein